MPTWPWPEEIKARVPGGEDLCELIHEPWEALAAVQDFTTIDWTDTEEADVFALLRRTEREEKSPFEQKVFAVLPGDKWVVVFDAESGVPIHDPSAGMEHGLLPACMEEAAGNLSMESDFSGVYSGFPMYKLPEVERAPAQGGAVDERDSEMLENEEALREQQLDAEENAAQIALAEKTFDGSAGGAQDVSPGEHAVLMSDSDVAEFLKSVLIMGARVKHDKGRGTIVVRKVWDKADYVCTLGVVLDSAKHLITKVDRAMLTQMRDNGTVVRDDTTPESDRCVGVFLSADGYEAEGYFWGGGYATGVGAFLAARYIPNTECNVDEPRMPRRCIRGQHVLAWGRQFVHLKYLIVPMVNSKRGKVRYLQLVGDEAAFEPSSSLKKRFYLEHLMEGGDMNVEVAKPPSSCESSVLFTLLTACYLMLTAHCSLLTTYYLLPTTYYLLPTTYYLLLATYCPHHKV